MVRSPFPGMDPYLEAADLWPDVHERLPNIYAEQLAPLLAPKYVAELNTQILIERWWDEPAFEDVRLPDLTITQGIEKTGAALATTVITPPLLQLEMSTPIPTRQVTVKIRLRENNRVVTVIELLSPINKRTGPGREEYLEKRDAYIKTGLHIVEIDLLRRGPRMPFHGTLPRCHYLIAVRNAYRRPNADLWPLSMRQPLPVIPVPLLQPDPDVPLDLGFALRTAYERARYDLRVDYSKLPEPPLSEADREWVREIIKEHQVQ